MRKYFYCATISLLFAFSFCSGQSLNIKSFNLPPCDPNSRCANPERVCSPFYYLQGQGKDATYVFHAATCVPHNLEACPEKQFKVLASGASGYFFADNAPGTCVIHKNPDK